MNEVDILEECSDNIVTHLECFIFEHPYYNPTKLEAIKTFVNYCCTKNKKAIAPDNKSCRQRKYLDGQLKLW